ncbi:hypothetical protein Pint_17647 [Pistacia integerrima]|uniref:Uncharacterized protein n=1 Tax=Pistacia integerrima TaxID=434235 RepID=A0ACC0YXB1_9ROSI|nr:hypothetical protein Pint_17647 [Pistacia integerrima]
MSSNQVMPFVPSVHKTIGATPRGGRPRKVHFQEVFLHQYQMKVCVEEEGFGVRQQEVLQLEEQLQVEGEQLLYLVQQHNAVNLHQHLHHRVARTTSESEPYAINLLVPCTRA